MEWLGYPAVESYKGLNLTDLPLNHAWVIANTTVDNIGVYSVRDDCFNCPYKLEKHLKAHQPEAWKVDTSRAVSWMITRTESPDTRREQIDKNGWLCQLRPNFEEYGVYRLEVGRCEVRPAVQPVHTYYPLILFSLVLFGVCAVLTSIRYLWRHRHQQQGAEITQAKIIQTENGTTGENSETLYLFRGVLLFLIIFLSTGGGGYPLLTNTYGGLSLAECLFFAYIWSIGVRIPSLMEKVFNVQTKCTIVRDIFVRAFTLIFLGTAIDFTVDHHDISSRLWCPLQKIGIAYFIVATAYLLTVQKFEMKSKKMICKVITNLMSLLWCWIISGFLLAIIVILISTIISFNCLAQLNFEDVRPEVDIKEDVSQNCNNYVTQYANIIFVGDSKKIINGNGYNGFSGGLMGVMSSIIIMMIGLKAGVVYLHYKPHADRFKLWTFWSTLFGLGGICFAVVSYPLNFNLWPISSILVISAAAANVFSLVYLIAEVFKVTSKILTSLGATSLVVLCGHVLFSYSLPFTWGIPFNNHLFYLAQNLWIVFLWLIVGIILTKKDVEFEM